MATTLTRFTMLSHKTLQLKNNYWAEAKLVFLQLRTCKKRKVNFNNLICVYFFNLDFLIIYIPTRYFQIFTKFLSINKLSVKT